MQRGYIGLLMLLGAAVIIGFIYWSRPSSPESMPAQIDSGQKAIDEAQKVKDMIQKRDAQSAKEIQ